MINLLPITEKQKIRETYRFLVLSMYLIVLSLVLLVAILSFLPSFFITDSKYQKILAESQTKEAIIKQSQEQEIKKIITDTNAKIVLLKSTTTPSSSNLFYKILESRPVGVYITNFSYDTTKKGNSSFSSITMQGTAENRTKLLSFVEVLSKENSFSSVDLPISNLISDTNVSYTLNIAVAPLK